MLLLLDCTYILSCDWRVMFIGYTMSAQESHDLMGDTATPAQQTEDPITAALKLKILTNFSVFDHENTKTVDVSEVRAIIASLELYPTQTELHDLITEMEEEEPTGYITYQRFEPVSCALILTSIPAVLIGCMHLGCAESGNGKALLPSNRGPPSEGIRDAGQREQKLPDAEGDGAVPVGGGGLLLEGRAG